MTWGETFAVLAVFAAAKLASDWEDYRRIKERLKLMKYSRDYDLYQMAGIASRLLAYYPNLSTKPTNPDEAAQMALDLLDTCNHLLGEIEHERRNTDGFHTGEPL